MNNQSPDDELLARLEQHSTEDIRALAAFFWNGNKDDRRASVVLHDFAKVIAIGPMYLRAQAKRIAELEGQIGLDRIAAHNRIAEMEERLNAVCPRCGLDLDGEIAESWRTHNDPSAEHIHTADCAAHGCAYKIPLEHECADLRHDIARYVAHNAELATENATLRELFQDSQRRRVEHEDTIDELRRQLAEWDKVSTQVVARSLYDDEKRARVTAERRSCVRTLDTGKPKP